MTAVLLIRNSPNSYRTGEVIDAFSDETYLTDGTDKTLYEKKKGVGSWDLRTVVAVITDKNTTDTEILALLEDSEDGETRRSTLFQSVGAGSPFYDDLVLYAKAYATYNEIIGYIK